jgi:hypothetical protein
MSSAPHRKTTWLNEPELSGILRIGTLGAGEPRHSEWTGLKALMLAVLEEGLRTYLGASGSLAEDEAGEWLRSDRRRSPFAFVVICETLGLDPDAVRLVLTRLRQQRAPQRSAVQRARPNVRGRRRVCAAGIELADGRRKQFVGETCNHGEVTRGSA